MEVATASGDSVDLSPPMDRSPSRSGSDAASEAVAAASSPQTPDRNYQPSPSRDVDVQSSSALRSEEYRQLFRLPPEEVLEQDFNCALQESILLQGHMYVFKHYICFYSNIFGFETKKIIPFWEITSVKRAKTAGIFPNAIEIVAGGKKHFFASFLSRDEAFKLINDRCLQQNGAAKAITEQQECISGSDDQENGLMIEKVNSFRNGNESDSNGRHEDAPTNVSQSSTDTESDTVLVTLTQQQEVVDNVEQVVESAANDVEHVVESATNEPSSSSTKRLEWCVENVDAPEVPKTYTRVAETKFPIKVEEFFNLFFSDDAIKFVESFHRRCGDKEFKCSAWYPHEKFGHARDVSFQHPIKIYFGTKCGSCQEVQKFRVYRNSHLVIETSQEINDVPYGDYFRVQGLWDVVRDGEGSNEGCISHVYVHVAFSKKTVFKGKIVQSTLEECREAYALWIEMAHDLLKQRNLDIQEESPTLGLIKNDVVQLEREVMTVEASERLSNLNDRVKITQLSDSMDVNQQAGNLAQENFSGATMIGSSFGEYMTRFSSFLKNQSQVSLILVVAFIVIFLMQVSILVLLNRPQTVNVASPGGYYIGGMSGGMGERSSESVDWLERRMHHLKDELYMVEAQLDRLRQEHAWLKVQLNKKRPK